MYLQRVDEERSCGNTGIRTLVVIRRVVSYMYREGFTYQGTSGRGFHLGPRGFWPAPGIVVLVGYILMIIIVVIASASADVCV